MLKWAVVIHVACAALNYGFTVWLIRIAVERGLPSALGRWTHRLRCREPPVSFTRKEKEETLLERHQRLWLVIRFCLIHTSRYCYHGQHHSLPFFPLLARRNGIHRGDSNKGLGSSLHALTSCCELWIKVINLFLAQETPHPWRSRSRRMLCGWKDSAK